MSSPEQAIARIRAGRERWVELEPGKTVLLRRPAESEFPAFFRSTGDGKTTDLVAGIEDVQKHVVNWRGFTEADLFGAADGSSDPIEFSQSLWAEVVSDNADWSHLVAKELIQQIVTHIKGKGDAAKN